MYKNICTIICFITQVLIYETKIEEWELLVYTASTASLTYSLSVYCHQKGKWAAIDYFLLNDQHYGLYIAMLLSSCIN